MAKFKKGDRVRCVRPDRYREKNFSVGDIGVVDETYLHAALFNLEGGYIMADSRWELDTQPIPDTVTIGGVEYVRKPEPEHVWAWGQWARVNGAQPRYEGEYVFIVGALDDGFVPFTSPKELSGTPVKWIGAEYLTYISDATIPE